ncbi:response regulator [Spirosoma sp. KNUC1025]|uniref:response regulator n=1 Tax=Spirosoma sp. KNUC1025 TaxID=2894082 RepID=UPI001E5159E4|nr:response regulator [Spirosoma sp. KNUC1025]UFH57749.1 response regulator [Spirosoma sp. KNUC1025]
MPHKQTILLVDDEKAIADILNRAAAAVFPAAEFIHIDSFNEAVEYFLGLKGKGPRLILLDYNLHSSMTGLDFLHLVRHHPHGRLVPVVILSSNPSERLVKEALLFGASAVTAKPFSFADWKAYVGQLRSYWFDIATIPSLHFC